MTFLTLGLAPELLRAVADQGYTEPTPVQAQAIPLVLAGRDVLAAAQTGTGKTAAFVLPMLQLLTPPSAVRGTGPGRHVRALVLTPTRELALQVEESVRTYGALRPVRSTTIYGGVGFDSQVRALRAGPQIVVATPGRLLDHIGQRTLDLGRVEILVLDEADRMLDMGFIRDIRRILALLPVRRQNLMFSATFSDEIRQLAAGILHDPASVQVSLRNTTPELVRQLVHPVDRDRKRELLSHLIRAGRIDQALVFTRTKHGANRLAEQLGRDGILAAAIHGNKSQPQRVRALDDFKRGRVAVLVATDIAARGLDIDALPHVVNYELPMVAEDYVHRIGRTGRAGVDGVAISLVCVDETPLLRDIERLLRRPVPSEVVPGFEPDRSIPAEPIRMRSGAGRSMGRGVAPRSAQPTRTAGGVFGQRRPSAAPPSGGAAPLPSLAPVPTPAVRHGPHVEHRTPAAGSPARSQRPVGGAAPGRRDGSQGDRRPISSGSSIGQGPRPQPRPWTHSRSQDPPRLTTLPGERLSRGSGTSNGDRTGPRGR